MDEEAKFVYVVDDAGKQSKKTVNVGQTQGEQVEITAGLDAGAKVLLEKPAE
jgi:multidrug efflux pump subunit AcrA (membrane-fusion protein)